MALKPIKVSQVNSYIKRILGTDPILGNLSVTGEISNLKYHDTGHVYFTLKDEGSKLSCFLPESNLANVRYELEDGMEVTAMGRVNVYEKGGTYSLYVSGIEVSGIGDLTIAFQKLKEKLEKEGLFHQKHKKQIPMFSKKIAVITAETGAAVRDILRTIQNKNNKIDVIVYPCLVQGNGAAADISQAIKQVNVLFPEVDCIILGRGGGSIEELWAFNEEIVARSIYESKIPIISAVGHETDFTISDFVADYRSATPTAAAELAAFDSYKLKRDLSEMRSNLKYNLEGRIRHYQLRLTVSNMDVLKGALLNKIEKYQVQTTHMIGQIAENLTRTLEQATTQVNNHKLILESLNPSKLLERGYAAVTDANGVFLHSVDNTETGKNIIVNLSDGSLDCLVEGVNQSTEKPKRKKK